MHFAQAACHITIVIRGDSLKSTLSQYLIDRIAATPNINVLTQTEVTALDSDEVLREITLTQRASDKSRTVAKWLFVCIGGESQTQWASEVGIVRDAGGYLVTGPDLVRNGRCPAHWPLDREPYFSKPACPGCSRPAMCATARSSAAPRRWVKARWRWRSSIATCLVDG